VRLARNCPTHLASKTIAIKHKGTGFLGNRSGKSRLGFWCLQEVLTRLEFTAVVVRQDLVTLFGTQFSNPSGPFGLIVSNRPQFFRVHDATDVRQEVPSQFCLRTQSHLLLSAHGQARLSLGLAAAWRAV